MSTNPQRTNGAPHTGVAYLPVAETSVPRGEVVAEALRWYAADNPAPGARIVTTRIGAVLFAVSSPNMFVWVDEVRLNRVELDVFQDRFGVSLRDRPAPGKLVVPMQLRSGKLIRVTGADHYVIIHDELVGIDRRVYEYLARRAGLFD